MKVKKHYSEEEIFNAARIGYEFEFYSSLDVVPTAKALSKVLKKRVLVPMALSNIQEPKPLYHSPVTPSSTIFKLEPDYSGGKKMCELVTGPLDYNDARDVLVKVFSWIQSNGYTTDRCSVHANISLDPNKIPTRVEIPMLDIVKFILSFSEEKVYSIFPERRDSVYAQSIKNIRPNAVVFYTTEADPSSRVLQLPNEKYYGVNFLKASKGYLEYRYMGGANYEKKVRKILELVDYFIMHLYETLNFDGVFTQNERGYIKKMMERQQMLYNGFVKYTDFRDLFPEIELGIDMRNDEQILEAMWGIVKEPLFKILMTSGIKKGIFNFDTDLSVLQVKDTTFKKIVVQDIEFVNCKIEGILNRCTFLDCEVSNSRVQECNATKNNTFTSCKIADTPLHVSNVCNDCFIENKRFSINCEVNDGVIRNGEIGKLAKISKETMVVELIEPSESPGSYKDPEKGGKKKKK